MSLSEDLRRLILDDLRSNHPDALSIDVLSVERADDKISIRVELRTEDSYLVYTYVIDKSGRIERRELSYAVPLI